MAKKKDSEVMVLQLLETEPEQLTKIGAIVWGMTGAAIGVLFVFISLVGFLLNFVPGVPSPSIRGTIFLTFTSIVLTIVLTFIYALMGAALGGLTSTSVNWILNKMGGIKLKVRKLK